jgi:adenylate cyclase
MADEELAVVMGRWFSACQQLVERHGGTINKYLGDGFFAYWPHSEAARVGLLAALGEFQRLQEARSPAFRLVVHHGQVVMGGRASLGEESLSGREVNFVFRMERPAAELRLARLLGEPTRQLLAGALATTEAGAHALPGLPGTSHCATFKNP